MSTTYTIWIVSPEEVIWSHVFDEVALGLQSAFNELGYDVPIVTDSRQIRGKAIVFGANLVPMYKVPLPEDVILFNLEQAHEDSRWFKPDYGYTGLLKKHTVWDFSHQNITALRRFGIENVIYCGIGYAPELTRIPHRKEDIDVLFVGGDHPRRKKIFDQITGRGVKFHQVYKVFGKERDDWIARGKVHLNLHKEPAQLLEIVRIAYLLSNKCFVVSEVSRDEELEKMFKDALVLCPYDQLAERCMHYLVRPKERKQMAEAGFEIFRQMPQKTFLASALEQTYQLHKRHHVKSGPLLPVTPPMPRIFVAIASFRDTECQPTVIDLFRKAAHPDRIRVGVCLQVDPQKDTECMVDPRLRPGQISIKQVHYLESGGANWARDKALKMMAGEEYVLMIDSHMRFEPGWDELLIDTLARCPSEKPVLSPYSLNYDPPNHLDHNPENMLRTRIKELGSKDDAQLVHVGGHFVPAGEERAGIYPTPFCVANCIFTRSSTLEDVPIDPHIYFWGDEINYSARLWTHGYDIFQPDCVITYHDWVRIEEFHLHDYRADDSAKNVRSMERVKHLLGLKKASSVAPLVEIERYGLGKERSLDDLWKFAGIDWTHHTVTRNAQDGIWDMSVRDKALKKGSKDTGLPRIFVQIPSYRDPDCQWTVKDLFEKAKHPERIFVGICWQCVKGDDDDLFQEPYLYPEQVRVHECDASQSTGVGWARNLTQKLWQGEEFTLSIDSHMRFEPGWDDMLLSIWQECDDPKAIITSYPPGFTPPDECQRDWICGMSAKEFDKNGILLMHGKPAFEVGKNEPVKPIPGAFSSACFLFGPASLIQDVPYDPYIFFFGEEISISVRLWTHGYNFFHPNRLVIFHDWDRAKRRNTIFSDNKKWYERDHHTAARVRHLLKTERSEDAEALYDIEKYGLGNIRTLEEYQTYSGVDFAKKTIFEKGLKGIYMPYNQPSKVRAPAIINGGSGKDPKLFINIASYRDPECQWTVKDLFDKADKPDRINVGICWQFDPKEDEHCFKVTTRPEQVRMMPVDWREAEGVCWARHNTQQLWDGEDYTLMIDSHMRFVPGWDEMMIRELAECESDKPLLSSSPVSYTPPDRLGTHMNPTIRRAKPFFPDGNLRCHGEMLDRSPPKPLKGAFVVANFIFSRSDITPAVPYDPYLYFDQEEIMYAARLYTHGWDVFSSRQQFLYHYYNDPKVPGGTVRPLHWRDLHQEEKKRIRFLRERGMNRFNHLTRYKLSKDPEVLRELDIYGWGKQRTLDQYEAWSGIDFKRKIATERALRCQFIEDLAKYRDRPIRVPEVDDKKPVNDSANGSAAAAPVAKPPAVPTPVQTVPLPVQMAPAVVQMLEPGDFIPLFQINDTNKKLRAVENFGGRYCMLFFLPISKPAYVEQCLKELQHQMEKSKEREFWVAFIIDETVENLIEFKQKKNIPHVLCADPDRKLARAFGVCRPGEEVVPVAFVLNKTLKITHRHMNMEPAQLIASTLNDCITGIEQFRQKFLEPRVISETPPVLIVPDVLSPELCAKCIQSFRNGHTFEGTVGGGDNKAYRADVKVRTDHILRGDLLYEIDEKLSRSFFPEIKKIFGVEVTNREMYKIGLYTGEKGGFFKAHRDNFDSPLGYRQIAATIHLNDDYEGGGLRFPEYDENIYRPMVGSGIAFSCATMHEARPVTKGERFIVVAFVHGNEGEAFRHHYLKEKGEPLCIGDYTPRLRQYSEIRQSRDFFMQWREQNIRYDGSESKPAAVQQPVAPSPNIMINTIGNHQAKKIFESSQAIIFDDFLPEDVFRKVHAYALTTDYEYINTQGKVTRAWHINDGFPMKSCQHFIYNAAGAKLPLHDNSYPTKTALDPFMEYMVAMQPHVQHITGKQTEAWKSFSVASWLYPHGTGLSLHDDGAGIYSGAYVYFLNPTWRLHWGGLLLLMDEAGNNQIHNYRNQQDQMDFWKRKWLHANMTDEMLMEHGMAKCVFPKKNRMVFIANNAYHMVTRVNEQSGDNVRMSLAGFFQRK